MSCIFALFDPDFVHHIGFYGFYAIHYEGLRFGIEPIYSSPPNLLSHVLKLDLARLLHETDEYRGGRGGGKQGFIYIKNVHVQLVLVSPNLPHLFLLVWHDFTCL